jgi:hypothetical protein
LTIAGLSLGQRLRQRARSLWQWFFPPRVELPEEVWRLLTASYPTLDFRRVSFHHNLPHLLRAAAAQGMAVPAVLSPAGCRIYVRPRWWDTASVEGLGLLLHEAFHALQMQEAGPGLGLFRPFLILYFACAAGSGFRYHRHPMERDAYRVAGSSRSHFECTGGAPGCLEVGTSGLRFWRKLAVSTPGGRAVRSPWAMLLFAPVVLLWLLAWTGVVAVLALAKLLFESGGAIAAGLLWVMAGIVSLFERTFRVSSL